MRDRVNVPIDPKIKRMFLETREIHKKEWTEVLEKGALEAVMEVDPVKALEYQIKVEDERQEERRQVLIRTKSALSDTEKKVSVQKEDQELLMYREELFAKDERTFIFQWPNPNWDRVINRYQFKNKAEAFEFLRKRMMNINMTDLKS